MVDLTVFVTIYDHLDANNIVALPRGIALCVSELRNKRCALST